MNARAQTDPDLDPWLTLQSMMQDQGRPVLCKHPEILAPLVKRGCVIEPAGVDLYRLIEVGLPAWEDYLTARIRRGSPRPIIKVYQQTASTQELAKAFGDRCGLAVTNHQTAGRGRLNRRWRSEAGSAVLMSLAWPKQDDVQTHDRLSMRVGLAVAKAAETLLPRQPIRIKWPNDITIGGEKLAGILIEQADRTAIIGVGMNVHPPPPDDQQPFRATSLASQGGRQHRLYALQTLVDHLLVELDQPMPPSAPDAWRARSELGQTQTFENQGERITGEVLDLDPDAGLIVRRDSGEIVVLPAATTTVLI
ncbi:MAG: biotin--[acetyl-CoA-carboxylase] ligase [Planctomycetota bacterium]